MLQVYTGNGKGKTTAAFGLALRMAGSGKKIRIVQFMKGQSSSEREALLKLPEVEIFNCGRQALVTKETMTPEDNQEAARGIEKAREYVRDRPGLLVLDEINVALYFGLVELKDVLEIINALPEETEIVCTGRRAPQELIDRASLVTEMKEVKHPFNKGMGARRGVEY